ncbi:hypothetical protein N7461_007720 [Penicillium sp. DV-2018c]|nr:hypothetical protein N7461_007720 [Penicillium sp. DV-2018c]
MPGSSWVLLSNVSTLTLAGGGGIEGFTSPVSSGSIAFRRGILLFSSHQGVGATEPSKRAFLASSSRGFDGFTGPVLSAAISFLLFPSDSFAIAARSAVTSLVSPGSIAFRRGILLFSSHQGVGATEPPKRAFLASSSRGWAFLPTFDFDLDCQSFKNASLPDCGAFDLDWNSFTKASLSGSGEFDRDWNSFTNASLSGSGEFDLDCNPSKNACLAASTFSLGCNPFEDASLPGRGDFGGSSDGGAD